MDLCVTNGNVGGFITYENIKMYPIQLHIVRGMRILIASLNCQ